jgi:beta-1,4-mannosyl-glycoprotein beta-1,4-N-acetylglucosaminyltransferase
MSLILRIKNKIIIKLKKIYFFILSTIQNIFAKNISKEEVVEYRKKIKIYDIFNFFNELELLEIRLNILDPYVDYFVIVESRLTHSGLPKELYYENNKDLFNKFSHKIIHYIIEEPVKDFDDARKRLSDPNISEIERSILDLALNSDSVPKDKPHFLRDFYEKESVRHAITNLNDDDFCFISDLDEIWNPDLLIDYSSNNIYKFRQLAYYYYLNNRSNEPWVGTTAARYGAIKNKCINHIRNISKTRHTFVNNGGWHFTYQGGADRVKQKLESFSHQEFNNDETKKNIKEKLIDNKDVVGRKFKFWVDESDLPKYLLNNKDRYKKLFKI